MKTQWIITALAVVLLQAPTWSVAGDPPKKIQRAEGTGVGNGIPPELQAYRARLAEELGRLEVYTTGIDSVTRLSQWCSSVVGRIIQARDEAMTQLQQDKLEQAEDTLVYALRAAEESLILDPGLAPPFTRKLIQRGVEMHRAIWNRFPPQICADPSSDCSDDERRMAQEIKRIRHTVFIFLAEYVTQIQNASRELDRPYYIPYYYRYNQCGRSCPSEFDSREYDRRLIKFAKEQISFPLVHLTTILKNSGSSRTSTADDYYQIFPAGDPYVFLTVTEFSARNAKDDIAESIYGEPYACAYDSLQRIASTLGLYNLRQQTFLDNDISAMVWAFGGMVSALDDLGRDSCAGIIFDGGNEYLPAQDMPSSFTSILQSIQERGRR